MKQISASGDLKKATAGSFIFLSPEKILARPGKRSDAGIFTFLQGKRLAKFALAATEMEPTANPSYVIVKRGGDVISLRSERGELMGAL